MSKFTDQNSISNSLKIYVAIAVQKELINGFDDGTFRGQNTLTRAEAATLLWRAFQYGNDNKVVNTPTTPITTPTATPTVTPTTTTEEITNTAGENIIASSDSAQQTVQEETQETEKIEQTAEKPYIIDTLKQVDLESDFTYDGEKIYYISETKIYSLDTYTGKTKTIYSTDDLVLQKTEIQEKEVTRTITVPVEDNSESAKEDIEIKSKENSKKTTENIEEVVEDIEETESNEPKETTKEITEIIKEEVVVEEYSNYTPTQIKYDSYNNRLIMTGYYNHHEKAFETPNNNAGYFVSYDITNNKLFWEFGVQITITNEELHETGNANINDIKFVCFLSKNKVILSNDYRYSSYPRCYYLANIDTLSNLNHIDNCEYNEIYPIYQSIKNNLYKIYIYKLYKYDFSISRFSELFDFSPCCVGIKNENIYYWSGSSVNKLNLSSGKTSELPITTDSEYCDILDMTNFSLQNFTKEFIPVSDTHFVFYDETTKAFRTLSEK